jgi:Mandelate racemase / muconate lactonizing enzyme, N-terminal domain
MTTTNARSTPHCSLDGVSLTRRSLLKSAGLGGLSLAAMTGVSLEDQIAHASQHVNRSSRPSDLRITDLRIAQIRGAPMQVAIIRIDTNQGLTGYGEVRDGGSPRYALMLKSRLLGENPCNVERLFRKTKQFGSHGRQGGGVSGVEMALWDLAGKAYVPVSPVWRRTASGPAVESRPIGSVMRGGITRKSPGETPLSRSG